MRKALCAGLLVFASIGFVACGTAGTIPATAHAPLSGRALPGINATPPPDAMLDNVSRALPAVTTTPAPVAAAGL